MSKYVSQDSQRKGVAREMMNYLKIGYTQMGAMQGF